jgi:hypothetical protein
MKDRSYLIKRRDYIIQMQEPIALLDRFLYKKIVEKV